MDISKFDDDISYHDYQCLMKVTNLENLNNNELNKVIKYSTKFNDFEMIEEIIDIPNFIFLNDNTISITRILISCEKILEKYLKSGRVFSSEIINKLIRDTKFINFVVKFKDLIVLDEDNLIHLTYHDTFDISLSPSILDLIVMNIRERKINNIKIIFPLMKDYCFKYYYQLIVDDGTIVPTIDHLEFVCKYNSYEHVKYILEHNVIPTYKCFELVFDRSIHIKEKVLLLLEYGLIITYDDVYKLVCYDIVVPDFYKRCIKPDKTLLLECLLKHDVIFDYFDNMDFSSEIYTLIFRNCNDLNKLLSLLKDRKIILTIEHLRSACQVSGNLDIVKYLIEKHNIKPDKTCLMYVCETRYNNDVIEYLFSLDIKFDLECLEKYIANMESDSISIYDMPDIFNHIEIETNDESTKRLIYIIEHLICHVKKHKGCEDCYMCKEL